MSSASKTEYNLFSMLIFFTFFSHLMKILEKIDLIVAIIGISWQIFLLDDSLAEILRLISSQYFLLQQQLIFIKI